MAVLTFLHDLDHQFLTRQVRHAKRLRQLIDIEYRDALYNRNLVEIIVKRTNNRLVLLSECKQPLIHAFSGTATIL